MSNFGVARCLYLDSSSCSGVSNGIYTWQYPRGLVLGPPGCTVKCYLLHAHFYNVIYNVPGPAGSTLSVTLAGTTTTVNLSQGQYDVTSFISAVQAAFPLITLSYSTSTGKITLSSSSSFTVRFSGSTVLSQLGLSTTSDTVGVLSGSTYSVTAPYLASLGAPRYLQITSSLHSLNVQNYDIESGSLVLARVPIAAFWGESVSWQNVMGSYSTILDSVIHRLDIKMSDSSGAAVDFGGTVWSMGLFFEAIPDPDHLSLLDRYGLESSKNVSIEQSDLPTDE